MPSRIMERKVTEIIANKLKKSEMGVYKYDEESLKNIDSTISEVLFSEEEFYRIFDELELKSKVEKSHQFVEIQKLQVQEILLAPQYNPIEQLKEKIRKNPEKNWIPISDDNDIETDREETRMFFLQLLLLDLYDHNKIIGSEITIYKEEAAKNKRSDLTPKAPDLQSPKSEANEDVITNQDLWLWVKFNDLKENGEIPKGYEYKAFLGLVRKLIEEAAATHDIEESSNGIKESSNGIEESSIEKIAAAVKKDFDKKEKSATSIQKNTRGYIERKRIEERSKMQEEDVLARSVRDDLEKAQAAAILAEAEKLKEAELIRAEDELTKEKELARLVQVDPVILGGEAESKGDSLEEDREEDNKEQGYDRTGNESKKFDNSEEDFLSSDYDSPDGDEGRRDGGVRGDGDGHDAPEGYDHTANSKEVKEKLVRGKGENSSLSSFGVEEFTDSSESGVFKVEGGDHLIPGIVKRDDQSDEKEGYDHILRNGKSEKRKIDNNDRPFNEDEDEDEDEKEKDDDWSENSSVNDNNVSPEQLEFLNLSREIDYQYLEDNHDVSSKDGNENYLIPEITGTKDESNFPTGKVLQYASGLPVSCYKDLNDFSQDVEKAALKQWTEGEESLLSSIAHIEDKNIGAKYCVVNASVRGVTKIFISDEEFDKIRKETDKLFLEKCSKSNFDKSQLSEWPNISREAEELMRSVSWEYSDKIARDVEKSIGNEVINGLDTLEVESIAKDFVETHGGKNSFGKKISGEDTTGLKGEISKILEAPVPHTNLNGVGFHRPRETKIVSVGFSYNNAGDEGKLEGNTEAYAYISGSYQCYIRCQVCPQDGAMSFCENGKSTSKEFKRGDTVIDKNTISFLNPETGKYTDVKASIEELKQHLEKITKEESSYYPAKTNLEKEAQKILNQYQAMQIKVTSQVNRVGFEEKPDIERKVSIMHKGMILSYNAEAPDKTMGKKKIAIAKDFFQDSGGGETKKFVKINKISLSNTKSVDLCVKFSTENGKVTHESKPFFAEEDTDGNFCYGELTHDYIKRNSDSSVSDAAVYELLSRAEYDCKNTKLIFGEVGGAGYKISTSEDFAGPGNINTPSSIVSEAKVTSLSKVPELWIKDKVIGTLNNR